MKSINSTPGIFWQAESDNAILFTVQFYLLCYLHGDFQELDQENLIDCLYSLQRIKDGRIIRGLFNRKPLENTRTQHHDDYVAIALAPLFGIDDFAKDIVRYGNKNFHCYNNVNPGKFSILRMRQPFDIMFYRIMAKEPIGIIGAVGYIQYFFKILFYLFQDKSKTSSKLLDWLRLNGMKKWYILPLTKLFNAVLLSKYKAGIYDLIKIYHYTSPELQELAAGIVKVE